MARIGDVLVVLNPWWKGEFHVEYKDREIPRDIQRVLPLRPMVALTGVRRTGKTTLLLKTAEDAVRQGTDPLDVVYFSFEHAGRGRSSRESVMDSISLIPIVLAVAVPGKDETRWTWTTPNEEVFGKRDQENRVATQRCIREATPFHVR